MPESILLPFLEELQTLSGILLFPHVLVSSCSGVCGSACLPPPPEGIPAALVGGRAIAGPPAEAAQRGSGATAEVAGHWTACLPAFCCCWEHRGIRRAKNKRK